MIKIDEIQIENKLKDAPKEISEFVSTIYVNPVLEQLIGTDIEDYDTIIVDLADAIVYFVLGFISLDQFKKELAEILYLDGVVEIQKAYDAINKFVLSKLDKGKETVENKIGEAKNNDSNHISHQDLLSEIENPTPSISTTAAFQNSSVKIVTAVPNEISKTVTNTTSSTNKDGAVEASLHSSATVPAYTNPALKIASKLDQNMSAPSASIPKDIYVSKKPDPYHEPVDL
jgi:hypothetical protein